MNLSELVDELIPVGRGATALKICLDVIAKETKKRDIIVPSMTCPSVISVIRYSGFDPIFCDVELDTLTISENTVSKVITQNTAAILSIYLFGHNIDIDSLSRYAKINSCYLIEDICQSFGGKVGNKLMGLNGDFTILSFAKGKIIDLDGYGGLIVKDSRLKKISKHLISLLPQRKSIKNLQLLSKSYRNLYHSNIDLMRANKNIKSLDYLCDNRKYFKDIFFYGSDFNEKEFKSIVKRELINFSEFKKTRLKYANLYLDVLNTLKSNLTPIISWQNTGIIWRLSFIEKDPSRANKLINFLRGEGIHLSNHYWEASRVFGKEIFLQNSYYASRSIINLFVDYTVNEKLIIKTNNLIEKFYNKISSK